MYAGVVTVLFVCLAGIVAVCLSILAGILFAGYVVAGFAKGAAGRFRTSAPE